MNSPAARDWGLNWSRWLTRWLFQADRDSQSQLVCFYTDKTTTLNVGGVDFSRCFWMICCRVRWMFSHNTDKDALSCFEETMRTFGTSNEVMWLCHEPMITADQRTLIACLQCFIILYKCYRLPLSALFATCVSAEFAQFTESTSNCLHLMYTMLGKRNGASVLSFTYSSVDEGEFDITQWQKEGKNYKNMNKNLVLCHVLFECCLMLKKVCEVGMCSDCFTMKKLWQER